MADTSRTRRWPLFAFAWLFIASAAAAFAWQTAGAYVRQNFQPLPGEAGLTTRECQAVTDCAPDALDAVNEQLTLLRQARLIVHLSSWTLVVLAAIVVSVATVLVVERRHSAASRFTNVAWKAQTAIAVILLFAQVAMLTVGATSLTAIPELARLTTSTKAFEGPFTDIGHLYYLAWFSAIAAAAALLTWTLRRSQPVTRD